MQRYALCTTAARRQRVIGSRIDKISNAGHCTTLHDDGVISRDPCGCHAEHPLGKEAKGDPYHCPTSGRPTAAHLTSDRRGKSSGKPLMQDATGFRVGSRSRETCVSGPDCCPIFFEEFLDRLHLRDRIVVQTPQTVLEPQTCMLPSNLGSIRR